MSEINQQRPSARKRQTFIMRPPAFVPAPHTTGVFIPMHSSAFVPFTPFTTTMKPSYLYSYNNNNNGMSQNVNPINTTKPAQETDVENEVNPHTTSGVDTSGDQNEDTSDAVKEKTPMCLVNELTNYNKILYQYHVIDENGPPHKKKYTIKLVMGTEEYISEGSTIKKAQHSAAAQALGKTRYKHPPPKAVDNRLWGSRSSSANTKYVQQLEQLTATRGEKPIYFKDECHFPYQETINHVTYFPRQQFFGTQARCNFNGQYTFRPHYTYDGRFDSPYSRHCIPLSNCINFNERHRIRLVIGDREYSGSGSTLYAARENAALKAIYHTKDLYAQSKEENTTSDSADDNNAAKSETDIDSGKVKSPISLVYETALKRKLTVVFTIMEEIGPPHQKAFITECCVGEIRTQGEGKCKKKSKLACAENMLEELTKLPPLSNETNNRKLDNSGKRNAGMRKRTSRNVIKVNVEQKTKNQQELNPISRLVYIQQCKKGKTPTYQVIQDPYGASQRLITMEASVEGRSAHGVGPNKKTAKRNAAEALLVLLGYTVNSNNSKIQTKTNNSRNEVDNSSATTGNAPMKPTSSTTTNEMGRQLFPGVLLVNGQTKLSTQISNGETIKNNAKNAVVESKKQKGNIPSKASQNVSAKDKLMYITNFMNINVQFTDFPKANHDKYLTLISLSTTPSQVCHGEGQSIEESHESASLEALSVLSEIGLNNIDMIQQDNITK